MPLLVMLAGCGSSAINIEKFKTLGTAEFSQEKWAYGDELVRAKIIYSFLKKSDPINNKSRDFIVNSLGSNTGYYLYDEFPAYYLDDGKGKKILVSFVVDHESKLISEIYLEPDL